ALRIVLRIASTTGLNCLSSFLKNSSTACESFHSGALPWERAFGNVFFTAAMFTSTQAGKTIHRLTNKHHRKPLLIHRRDALGTRRDVVRNWPVGRRAFGLAWMGRGLYRLLRFR